jgi:hypothetical protein
MSWPTSAPTYRAAGMDGVAAKPIAPAALVTEILRLAQAATRSRTAPSPEFPPAIAPGTTLSRGEKTGE